MKIKLLFLYFISVNIYAQAIKEIPAPMHIKSVYFNSGNESIIPIFALGESFYFSFDDLYGEQAEYYYTIQHCDRNWKLSNISKMEYLQGTDDLQIPHYGNSMATYQQYTHYQLPLPNANTRFLVSGNYILTVLNANREPVFSRKFALYENIIPIEMQAKKLRNNLFQNEKQRLELSLDYKGNLFVNPSENFSVTVLRNGQWHNALHNIKPNYMLGTNYVYNDENIQFWGGNEYLYIDNSDITAATNTVAKTSLNDMYISYLHPYFPKKNNYYFYQDIDGGFLPRNKYKKDNLIESDYAWVYFYLNTSGQLDDIYVVGMFNNYVLSDENKLVFNENSGQYEVALLIKQGFTNYRFVSAKKGAINDEKSIDGNHFETNNNYKSLLYYKGGTDRMDRIIGYGNTHSVNITN